MDGKSAIVPLNDKNYATWKIQVKMFLIKEDLFGFIDGTAIAPDQDNTVEQRKFAARRAKALSIIVLAVDVTLLYLLGDPTDPVEVWNKLQATFQRKTWSNKLRLRRKLYGMKLKQEDSLQVHLKNFIELFDELAVIGDALKEEDKVINLLASLPDDYSTLVTALEAFEQVPSWENVTERLLHEEQKLKGKVGEVERSLVSINKYRANSSRRELKCFHCGKHGHIKKNCYVFKNKQKNPNANVAESNSHVTTLVASALLTSSDTNFNSWIIDSGATRHMCNKQSSFTEFVKLENPLPVQIGDGRKLYAFAVGKVSLKMCLPNDKFKNCSIENVLFVPKLCYNLLSIAEITAKGRTSKFLGNTCELYDKDKLIAVAKKVNKLYYLECVTTGLNAYTCTHDVKDTDINLWHRRLGHLGVDNLRRLVANNLVKGINFNDNKTLSFCESCCDGKNHRSPFPKSSTTKRSSPLELIHSDVCGKLNPNSLGGGNYFVTFIDDCSHYTWVYIIKTKDEVFEVFKDFKTLVENQFNAKVKTFRSDNGGEYTSNVFRDYLKKEGIRHETTIPKTPEQNGVAERMNRTLLECVRAMLSDSTLPKTFWAEAVSTAVYLRNRCPTNAVQDKTPYEALFGEKPSVDHLKIFGCTCYAHVPRDQRQKLDPKSIKCVFLGYCSNSKGYKLYDVNKKKILLSRDVIFHESKRVTSKESENSSCENTEHSIHLDESSETSDQEIDDEVAADNHAPRRSNRERRAPDYYGEWTNFSESSVSSHSTVGEALNGSDAHLWKAAMQTEMDSIKENNVYDLVKLPNDQKAIGCRWVFKQKTGADGTVNTYKARLVAQGYSQEFGIDYDETFSPVVRFESVRSILALAVEKDLEIHQMDVSSAFLNGELEETIYMKQPEGFVIPEKEHLVCKLNKSIYGLKQSPRCWNSSLDNYLKEIGFEQSQSDSCIYIKSTKTDVCYLAVYVDDIIIACKSLYTINDIKLSLSKKFKMKDLGCLNYFLGVNIVSDDENGTISLNQCAYTKALLEKFNMIDANALKTPVDVSVKLTKATEKSKLFDPKIYQSAVGSLLYLSTRTRPDIAYAVGKVARFCSKPTAEHWQAVKRIIRYLKGTYNYGLTYSKSDQRSCAGYSDADWAGDIDDRKSTSGYCFQFNGSLISWRSQKQPCVALSTAEAEYVALAAATQESLWLRQLFSDLKIKHESAMIIYEDNQSAICIAKNPKDHSKTKHIDIKFHFVRDHVENKNITLKYCCTDEMLADIFTKGLTTEKFTNLRMLIGVGAVKV